MFDKLFALFRKKTDSSVLPNPSVEEFVRFLKSDDNYYSLLDIFNYEYLAAVKGNTENVIIFFDRVVLEILKDGCRFINPIQNCAIFNVWLNHLRENPNTEVCRFWYSERN
jgi:hypothetical protein